jgi:hypothetical protein
VSIFSFTESEIRGAEEAHAREQASKPRPDMIPLLCAEIARLCDILRGERAYLALCTIFPSADPTAAARVREGQLRAQNALFLLREKRGELVDELNSLTA